MATLRWFIGSAPEEKPSVGTPVEVGITRCVTFGCFDDVRVVQEGNVGAPDNENKYYASASASSTTSRSMRASTRTDSS